ncbi:hypothetical protein [Reichenbachiella versicolor]|uniref:hypothetical protein n=1 Tax=Reichenbachiella versicolor TaxID=1821036 RepID=UPI0013A5AD41|nr:hypothetical protein [Reichenbachiella versicolor]
MTKKITLVTLLILISSCVLIFYLTENRSFCPSENELVKNKKIIPIQYSVPIEEALSFYPELNDIHIKFEVIENGIPFVSRPTIFSTLFRSAKNRRYLILIAKKSIPLFDSALMHTMPRNAQVGVIGHELAHTSDFINRNTLRMLRVAVGNLSSEYLDEFEQQTDIRTIDHGLGCNLLAWSSWIRTHINLDSSPKIKSIMEDLDKTERYLKPTSIVRIMKEKGYTQCEDSMYYQ